jgi:hypothetical protein
MRYTIANQIKTNELLRSETIKNNHALIVINYYSKSNVI